MTEMKPAFARGTAARLLAGLLAIMALTAGLTTAAADERYLLRSGDRIAVSVLEDPLMDQTSLIRPDGRISLAIAGSILAEGLTAEELQEMIAQRLRKSFVEKPTVIVALLETEEADPPAVFILGQVNSPGRVPMEEPLTLLQALAMAGGTATFAATERIYVRRSGGGGDEVLSFDYDAIEQGAGADIRLREGDVIVVPERGLFD